MSDLIVIVCRSILQAEEARGRLTDLQMKYLVELDNAAIAARTDAGEIRIDMLLRRTARSTTASSFWPMLIGSIFLEPTRSAGAATSRLATALDAAGMSDAFIKKLTAKFESGGAALFLLVRVMAADALLKELKGFGGLMLKAPLDEAKEQLLREAVRLSLETEQIMSKKCDG